MTDKDGMTNVDWEGEYEDITPEQVANGEVTPNQLKRLGIDESQLSRR